MPPPEPSGPHEYPAQRESREQAAAQPATDDWLAILYKSFASKSISASVAGCACDPDHPARSVGGAWPHGERLPNTPVENSSKADITSAAVLEGRAADEALNKIRGPPCVPPLKGWSPKDPCDWSNANVPEKVTWPISADVSVSVELTDTVVVAVLVSSVLRWRRRG